MKHAANELRYSVNILDVDGATVLFSGIGAGITDLSGRRLEQAQLMSAETTHMILLRFADATILPSQGYIQVTEPYTDPTLPYSGPNITLYIVDYVLDPRVPRPRVWTEVYCHVMRNA